MQAFLYACEDPDAPAIDKYCKGLRLGHMMQMPRTPAVFEAKRKWRLDYEASDAPAVEWAENYKTARERQDLLQEKIREDLKTGRMISTRYGATKARYGERLAIGAMGLVEEGSDKFRLIHDGTHGILVNNRIRVRDQLSSPMIQDLATELEEQEDTGRKYISVTWDYRQAHRIPDMDEEDWGLQACISKSFGNNPTGPRYGAVP